MQQLLTGKTCFPEFKGEWKVKQIREFASCTAGGTPSTLVPEFWGGSIPWMNSGELHQKQVNEVDRYITEYGLLNSSAKLLPTGCVLIGLAGQGRTRGTVAMNLIPLCTNQSIAAILPNSKFVPEYLFHNLDSRYTELRNLSSGDGGRGGLNLTIIGSMMIPFPSIPEQRAIATILSDIDVEIAALEARLEKSQNLKQAIMQQLLTGKTRLPGFEGEWEDMLLRDLLTYERPDRYIVKSTSYSSQGDIPVLTANKAFILGFTTETSGICTDLPTIVFDDFTTDSKFATVPFKVKSSAIKLLRPKNNRVSLKFLFELIQIMRFPVSEHKRHYISDYQNIELPIPDFEEQLAVESILSDMDAEISALEARREKTRDLKQAMMQELLTGKTRLATPGELNV